MPFRWTWRRCAHPEVNERTLTLPDATPTTDGAMSAKDKAKLDGLSSGSVAIILKFSGLLAQQIPNAPLPITGYLSDNGAVAGKLSGASNGYPLRACTAKNLRVNVSANSITVPATITVRKNDVDTAIAITIPGGATGIFTETATSVEFLENDVLDVYCTANSNGTMGITATVEIS